MIVIVWIVFFMGCDCMFGMVWMILYLCFGMFVCGIFFIVVISVVLVIGVMVVGFL